MLQLFSILAALLIGHSIPKMPITEPVLNKVLSASVITILFVMGYGFGGTVGSMWSEVLSLTKIISMFTLVLLVLNVVFSVVCMRSRVTHGTPHTKPNTHVLFHILSSTKFVMIVLLGIAAGFYFKWQMHGEVLNTILSIILFEVLFIIGHQLKLQDVSIRQIIANKSGMAIALIVILSSLLAGIVCSLLLHLKLKVALMLSCGFGWYTLSGILNGQLIGHSMGAASFFIDFLREMIAIVLIPLMSRQFALPLIGYCGATALDFTLPMIKSAYGEEFIGTAITSGMILTVIVPIIIPLINWVM
jgi:uncharacterized membrane protein YbjE (DUF340 family)